MVFLRLHNKLLLRGQDVRAGPAVRPLALPVADRSRLPAADRRPGRRHQPAAAARQRPDRVPGALLQASRPRSVPFMPVEYSGAAFRFGHSMIRAEYEMQDGHTVPIFGRDGYEDLRGNRPIPATTSGSTGTTSSTSRASQHAGRPQHGPARSTRSSRCRCTTLPPTVVAPTAGAIISLAERNLLRGKRLGLPSGQDVATAMGLHAAHQRAAGPHRPPSWKRQGKAPLWYYILKEAELLGGDAARPGRRSHRRRGDPRADGLRPEFVLHRQPVLQPR